MGDDIIGAVVLIEPLGGSFRAYLRHARDVVRGIANEGQVIDDLLWPYIEFRLNAIAIHNAFVHGVHERHIIVDELREVLVTCRHQYVEILRCSFATQRADDVVSLNTFDLQQRQPHCPDRFEQWLNLGAKIVRHRRAGSLVVGIQIVAERLARRVENDTDKGCRLFATQLVDH